MGTNLSTVTAKNYCKLTGYNFNPHVTVKQFKLRKSTTTTQLFHAHCTWLSTYQNNYKRETNCVTIAPRSVAAQCDDTPHCALLPLNRCRQRPLTLSRTGLILGPLPFQKSKGPLMNRVVFRSNSKWCVQFLETTGNQRFGERGARIIFSSPLSMWRSQMPIRLF